MWSVCAHRQTRLRCVWHVRSLDGRADLSLCVCVRWRWGVGAAGRGRGGEQPHVSRGEPHSHGCSAWGMLCWALLCSMERPTRLPYRIFVFVIHAQPDERQ